MHIEKAEFDYGMQPMQRLSDTLKVMQKIKSFITAQLSDKADYLRELVLWFALMIVFAYIATWLLKAFTPFDWSIFFDNGKNVPTFYPPWTKIIVSKLNYELLVGITVASFSFAVRQRTKSTVIVILSFFNLPLFWTIFLGQLDGLALLGVIGLPWLFPLTLMKPQLASFAILSQKRTIILVIAFLMLTFLIWGFWPLNMLSYHAQGKWDQDITLGWLGVPIGVLLFLKMPKDDADWWMLLGTLITPFLMPYNLLPLMPVVARLPKKFAAFAIITSWLPLSANWLGPIGWQLGWISIITIAVGLFYKSRPTGLAFHCASHEHLQI